MILSLSDLPANRNTKYRRVSARRTVREDTRKPSSTPPHTHAYVGNFDKQISAWTTWLRESSSDRYTSSGYSGFALVAWFFWCIPILQMHVVRTAHAYNARIHKNPIKIADLMQHRAEMSDRSRIFSHLTAEPATILHCWPFKVAAISNLFRVLVDGWKLQIGRTESLGVKWIEIHLSFWSCPLIYERRAKMFTGMCAACQKHTQVHWAHFFGLGKVPPMGNAFSDLLKENFIYSKCRFMIYVVINHVSLSTWYGNDISTGTHR